MLLRDGFFMVQLVRSAKVPPEKKGMKRIILMTTKMEREFSLFHHTKGGLNNLSAGAVSVVLFWVTNACIIGYPETLCQRRKRCKTETSNKNYRSKVKML